MTERLTFDDVETAEWDMIYARRKIAGAAIRPPNLVGLACSGGGIRSATFCLGVVQALDHHRVLEKVDYLSTVSGGGYFGSSLVNAMVQNGGESPFNSRSTASSQQAPSDKQILSEDIKDTDAVGHLRNYSNYLVPNGMGDFLTAAAVVARGFAANAALVLWVPILLAARTVYANPGDEWLSKPGWLAAHLGLDHPFAITAVLAVLAFLAFFAWALIRSSRRPAVLADATGWIPVGGALLLTIIAVSAFLEAQPVAIRMLFAASADVATTASSEHSLLTWFGALLAPATAFVTLFRQTLKSYLADTSYSSTYSALVGRAMAKLVLWIGALALPALIWLLYIHLSYWAIACDDCALWFGHRPGWLAAVTPFGTPTWLPYAVLGFALLVISWLLAPNANSLHHLYRDRLAQAFHFDMNNIGKPAKTHLTLADLASNGKRTLAPYLLINTAVNLQSSREANKRGRNADFFVLSPLAIGSKATGYLRTADYDGVTGDPVSLATAIAISGAAASSNMGAQTIRALSPTLAMLNVRLGYWIANPRALIESARRKAETARSKNRSPESDGLQQRTRLASRQMGGAVKRKLRNFSHFFLFAEMFGVMTEDDERVYLTDGGHIENLGIYELLQRKCMTIIVIDAEADPQMRFGSFITLQIYARIDLGIRIDLPVAAIRDATIKAMKGEATIAAETANATVAAPPVPAAPTGQAGGQGAAPDPAVTPSGPRPTGPHIAIGKIDYGGGLIGTLIYIKSSLSGDENDYIRDYVRRNPTFPHETTGDQFFSEEQFEVYRALGFHAAHRFFDDKDEATIADGDGSVARTLRDTAHATGDSNKRLAAALALLQPAAAPPPAPRRARRGR